MARDSAIEWTRHTFNPWWGCTKVSPACDHCYAETWAKRTGFDVWGADAPRRRLGDDYWNQPLRWDQDAAQTGRRARVFCASMADVFEWDRALDNLRERLWTLIESTPNLDWLLLTKRPHLARRLAPWASVWPTHVWLGTTVENQLFADRRIGFLLDVPCRYRFLSCEPLLEPVDLSAHIGGLHWVIAGGESGGRARPTHPDWTSPTRTTGRCEPRGGPSLDNLSLPWRPPGVAADLARVSVFDPFSLLSLYVGGPREVQGYGERALVQTDDRPLIEFSGPRAMYARDGQ